MEKSLPPIPENWEILNFPSTLEIYDKTTGKALHGVYKGGLVVSGRTADTSRHPEDESDWELKNRLIKETLLKIQVRKPNSETTKPWVSSPNSPNEP